MNRFFVLFVWLSFQALCHSVTEEEINKCLDKIESDFNECGAKVSSKWKCVLRLGGTQMYCNTNERQCCAMWDLFDCFTDTIGQQCGQPVADQINRQQFSIQIRTEESDKCSQFKYQSMDCRTLLSDLESQTEENTYTGIADNTPDYVTSDRKSDINNNDRNEHNDGEQEGFEPDIEEQVVQTGSESDKPRFRRPETKEKSKNTSKGENGKPKTQSRSLDKSKATNNSDRKGATVLSSLGIAFAVCSLYFNRFLL